MLTSVGLLAASAGAPEMSCMDANQADVVVANSERSATNPLLLRRDNPAIGGNLYVKSLVTGKVTNPFLTDGTWLSTVTGHTELNEYREHDWFYLSQRSPILPRTNYTGATAAPFGTRSGLMIHGNHYGIGVTASDIGGDTFAQKDSDFIALDPNVLLVPVVIVNWKRAPGEFDPYYKADQKLAATNMIDFNPVHLVNASAPAGYVSAPDNCDGFLCIGTPVTAAPIVNSGELSLQFENADGVKNYQYAPDKYENPPDEIWTTCGIQFQVVAQYDVVLPANWTNKCNVNGNNFPDPMWNTPLGSDPLLKKLDPIVISFGDDVSAGCPFWGVTNGLGGRHVEIDHSHGLGKGATTTAHELGHALGLDHLYSNGQPVAGNLMASNGPNGGVQGNGWTGLTPTQCTDARSAAANHSSRYDEYNYLIGRTYSSVPPPPPPAPSGDDGGTFDPGDGGGTTGDRCVTSADCPLGYTCIDLTCSPQPK